MRQLCGHRVSILGENNRVVLGHTYDYVEVAIQVHIAATGTFINRCFAWCFFSTIELAIVLVEIQTFPPCKRATTLVEQIKTAEKFRDLMYVLDHELQPLSPPFFMNAKHAADQLSKTPGKTTENMHDYDEELQPLPPPFHGQQQKAPQKSQTTLQRTTQRKVLV